MKAVILAGGMGTRLLEETASRPKPMVEIGERPIIWHIMNGYASFGVSEFVVALGYRGDVIKDYFADYLQRGRNLSIRLATGEVTEHDPHDGPPDDWVVHLIDTGLETQTGGRLRRLKADIGTETFLMTYGDGVADVDIDKLVAFHRGHGRLATVTAVRPPARFGSLEIEGEFVTRFGEKVQADSGWINGGFFVLEPGVIDYIEDDKTIWERAPLERLASDGQLAAYQHEGFWQPMDTLRDRRLLEELWASGAAPWRTLRD
jgi:glucose-1-phosphate cytidylyltransferase